MRRGFFVSALAIAAAAGALLAAEWPPDRTASVQHAVRGGPARGVILLIGDGLGDSEITAARNYHVGLAGRLRLDALPMTGACTVGAVEDDAPHRPQYVADSAAAATAWATGQRTSNRRVSTAAGTGERLTTILELAQAGGLATGLVTTAELVDATPAALAAHVNDRRCYGPEDMDACPQDRKVSGGAGSIAEQLVDHRIDVLLGGGRKRFEQRIDGGPDAGATVIGSATALGYSVIGTAAELEAARSGHKLLGLFHDGNMSAEWGGDPAAPYPGSGPQRCVEGRRPSSEPSLSQMTRKAIELLQGRPGGFFLQVEGASIDKRAHAADPCGQIGETVAFDAAVGVALDYAHTHPDTLVIVTGDHGHAGQIVPASTAADHSPGVFSTLLTADGAPMVIAYGTNSPGRSQAHTGTQVRVAGQGPQAANLLGVIDQTDLFAVMVRALRLRPEEPAPGRQPYAEPSPSPRTGHPR
jgi:alkaline phosphatase